MNSYFSYPDVSVLDQALNLLDTISLEAPPAPEDDPIFLASIGWRAGSTLLQRILMTDPDLLIWGEPMDRSWMLTRITQAMQAAATFWPYPHNMISERKEVDLAREWVAVLTPDAGHLKAGLRALFDKEVRWTGKDVRLLKWLYPSSKIIVIVRNPMDCFKSIVRWGDKPWELWVSWPDYPINDAHSYAEYWNSMMTTWAEASQTIPVVFVRYEDLICGAVDMAGIGAEFGLDLRPEIALAERVGGSKTSREITDLDRETVHELTKSGRALLGYV